MKHITPNYAMNDHPEVACDPDTHDTLSPEVTWFVYDFFKHELNGYEKLIFFSYYVNGLTMSEIAEICDCTFQYIAAQIKKIEKKMQYRWKHGDKWKVKHDSKPGN